MLKMFLLILLGEKINDFAPKIENIPKEYLIEAPCYVA